jgi:hypothetical protein
MNVNPVAYESAHTIKILFDSHQTAERGPQLPKSETI